MNKPVKCGCGGEAKVIHWDTNTPQEQYDVYCDGCGISTEFYPTEAEAITAWNRAMGERTAKVVKEDNICICDNCSWVVFTGMKYCPACGCKLIWGEDNE